MTTAPQLAIDAPVPPGIDGEVEAERIAAMFRQMPLAAGVTVVNAAVMTAVLQSPPADRRAFAWLAAVLLVAALRLGLWHVWRRRRGVLRRRAWTVAATSGAAVAGLLWGGGAVWLWPATESVQLFWVFLVGGMCIGAVSIHAAHSVSALAFLVPAATPLAACFAAEASARGAASAAMISVFLAALIVISRRTSAAFGDTVRVRLELAAQARSLAVAKARLEEEVATREATEASLRHAQKMEALGQLTGGIAHDFNNLLTAVLGSLTLLSKRLPAGDERAARLLGNAREGAQRGAALTQRLLAFGRRQALKPEAVRLEALVAGISALLHNALGTGIKLETRFPPDLPPVLVDTNQLELALLNLVVNARDAMPAGGSITIAGATRPPGATGLPPGAEVLLSVSDTGTGMDAETLAQAMEPFFTTKGVGKGTGLGLSMVHGLAAQSGGAFRLHSEPGVGTTAELWLPRAALAELPPPPPPVPAPPADSQARVLLVDDDPLVLGSTADMLDDLGYQVAEANSAAEALRWLAAGGVADLVVTDYAMPGMNGLDLAAELQRLRPGLPVLLATGYAAEIRAGAEPLVRLDKPFTQEALAGAINACRGRAAAA